MQYRRITGAWKPAVVYRTPAGNYAVTAKRLIVREGDRHQLPQRWDQTTVTIPGNVIRELIAMEAPACRSWWRRFLDWFSEDLNWH